MLPFWRNKNGTIKEASKWKRRNARFDKRLADEKVEFIETCCRHVKGELAEQLLKLSDWEREIVRGIFGWIRNDGTRLFREIYIEVPKKNGKSTFAAALADTILLTDGEPGAEIYSVASETDQANIIFSIAKDMIRQDEELAAVTETFRRSITYKTSTYQVLSADADTKEGKNSHAVLFDELHVQPNRDLYDNLKTGMVSRRQPLMIMLTTAGYDRNSICWEKHNKAIGIMDGTIDDPSFLGVVFAADPEDDWTSVKTWKKANPNFGVSVKESFLKEQCEEAQRSPAYENTFKRKHLDIWTEQLSRWLQMAEWDACATPLDFDRLKAARCFGGLDLASTTDIAALVLVFPDIEPFPILPFFWVPEEGMRDRVKKDRVPYDAWVKLGMMQATPGNLIDYSWIMDRIGQCKKDFNMPMLAFDRWGSTKITTDLCDNYGFTMDGEEAKKFGKSLLVQFGQGFASMSPPTKELLNCVLGRKIAHGGNKVLRWMASNMVVRADPAENIKPDKAKSTERIDGMVALIMALDLAIRNPAPSGSVYESRGIISL